MDVLLLCVTAENLGLLTAYISVVLNSLFTRPLFGLS